MVRVVSIFSTDPNIHRNDLVDLNATCAIKKHITAEKNLTLIKRWNYVRSLAIAAWFGWDVQ